MAVVNLNLMKIGTSKHEKLNEKLNKKLNENWKICCEIL